MSVSKFDPSKISGLTSIEYLLLLSLHIFFVNPTHKYVYIRCSENRDTSDIRDSVDNFRKHKKYKNKKSKKKKFNLTTC